MEIAVPDFVLDARKKLPRTDCLGPVDCRIRANPVRPISFSHIAGSDSIGYLICRLPSNFRDFTWPKFSDHNLLLTYSLEFLSIQAYRLWMEYPSREKDESFRQSRLGHYFR